MRGCVCLFKHSLSEFASNPDGLLQSWIGRNDGIKMHIPTFIHIFKDLHLNVSVLNVNAALVCLVVYRKWDV